VILSTHILPEVGMTCERVVIINRGRIAAVDSPGNLTARLKGSERVFLHVTGDFGEAERALRDLGGVTNVVRDASPDEGRKGARLFAESDLGTDLRPEMASRLVSRGIGLLEMRRIEMSLEEIFTELTTSEEEVSA
jgi:ABC-2 type transport system ATP-binding protein